MTIKSDDKFGKFKEDVIDWYHFDFSKYNPIYKIKRIFKQIKHVFYWIPIIWNDYEWDYDFLYDIIIFKLKNMHKFWSNIDNYQVVEEVAEETRQDIEKAIELFEILSNEKYEEEGMKEWYEKYPFPDDWDKSWWTEIEENGEKMYEYTPQYRIGESETLERCRNLSEEIYNKTWDDLGKLLKNKIRNWWD